MRDFVLYAPAWLLLGLTELANVPIFSRLFSQDEYGYLILALNTIKLASLLISAWAVVANIRFLPEYRLKRYAVYRASVWCLMFLLAGLAAVSPPLLSSLTRVRLDVHVRRVILLVGIGAAVSALYGVKLSEYRALAKPVRYGLFTALQLLGGYAVGLGLVFAVDRSAESFLLGLVAVPLLVLVFMAGRWLYVNRARLSLNVPSRSILRIVLAYGLPLSGVNLIAKVLSVGDRYVIGAYHGVGETALYNTGYALSWGSMALVSASLLAATEPLVYASWRADGAEATYRYLGRIIKLYVLVTAPLAITMVLIARPLVTIFVTEKYLAAASVFPYVILGVLLHGCTALLEMVYTIHHRTLLILRNFAIAGVVNVLLNIMLVPAFGYIASAWVTLLSYALLVVITLWCIGRDLQVSLHYFQLASLLGIMGRSLVAGLGGWLVIQLLWPNPLLWSYVLGILAVLILYTALVPEVLAVLKANLSLLAGLLPRA